jgi:DNA mismatch repair protein MutS
MIFEIFGMTTIVFILKIGFTKRDYAFETLTKHFQTVSKGFGIENLKELLLQNHFVLLSGTQHNKVHITRFSGAKMPTFGWIDLHSQSRLYGTIKK